MQAVPTAHNIGLKKVFLSSGDSDTALTQFSHGELRTGEGVETNVHQTMEELYYFLNGTGDFMVGNEKYSIGEGSFVRVPAGVEHSLVNTGPNSLHFVYFGVAAPTR